MSEVLLLFDNFNRSICRLAELPPGSHAPCNSPHGGRTRKCLSCWGCLPSPQGPYVRVPSHHLSLLTTHLDKLSGELAALMPDVFCSLTVLEALLVMLERAVVERIFQKC